MNGREISEDEYLELCLNLKPGKDEEVKRFNMTRACIRRQVFIYSRVNVHENVNHTDKMFLENKIFIDGHYVVLIMNIPITMIIISQIF